MIIVVMLYAVVVLLIGMLFGQHLLLKELREKGYITIKGWCYTATKVKGEQ